MFRVWLGLLLVTAATPVEMAKVQIGGTALRLPTPAGFIRYDGQSDKVDGLQASFAPPSNRILAAYGQPEDLEAVRAGKFPVLNRSLNAQENWQYATVVLDQAEFSQVRASLREQMGGLKSGESLAELERSASSALSHELDTNLKVRVGETVPLGVFSETSESICFALLVKSKLAGTALKETIEPVAVVAGCVLQVRDRLLYLFANSNYEGKSDSEWARQAVIAWRDAVSAANGPDAPAVVDDLPPEPVADEEESPEPWVGRHRWLIIGAGAAAFGWWWSRRRPGPPAEEEE